MSELVSKEEAHRRHKAFKEKIAAAAARLNAPVIVHPEAKALIEAAERAEQLRLANEVIAARKALAEEQSRLRKEILREVCQEISDRWKPRIVLTEISDEVCSYCEITVSALKSPRRDQKVMIPRLIFYYLARKLTNSSTTQIGRYLGGRDHTCTVSGVKRTKAILKDGNNAHFINALNGIESNLLTLFDTKKREYESAIKHADNSLESLVSYGMDRANQLVSHDHD